MAGLRTLQIPSEEPSFWRDHPFDIRAFFRAWLNTFDDEDRALQLELTSLSEIYQFGQATLSGHNVHLTEPELVVEKVIWVINQYRALRALTDIIHRN